MGSTHGTVQIPQFSVVQTVPVSAAGRGEVAAGGADRSRGQQEPWPAGGTVTPMPSFQCGALDQLGDRSWAIVPTRPGGIARRASGTCAWAIRRRSFHQAELTGSPDPRQPGRTLIGGQPPGANTRGTGAPPTTTRGEAAEGDVL